MKLMPNPAITNKIGYAIFILLASISIKTMMAINAKTNGSDSCIFQK
jgi:hypothetical protein